MDEPNATDEALMLRYRDGDDAAFERLYTRHKGPVYRYLLRHCGQPDLAEELFQDVWLRVVNARARYEVKARFTTWVYRIAHNRLVDRLRQTRPITVDPVEENDPPARESSQPEVQAHLQRQVARLDRLLDTLPMEQREAFVLREEAGLSIEAIAEATGVAHETAKSRLRYAVRKLRDGLGENP